MSELQEMQNRISQLEQETQNRVTQLEQENLALKSKGKAQSLRQRFVFGLAVVGVGMALLTHNGNTQTDSGTVICKELRVVDKNRSTVLWLTSSTNGAGVITVYNSVRNKVVSISPVTDANQGGGVWVNDGNGVNTASVTSSNGKGRVWTKQ